MLDEVSQREAGGTIDVHLKTYPMEFREPFQAYLSCRDLFGPESAFLLESLSGPRQDARSATVGFRPLLTVEIQNCRVSLSGETKIVDIVSRAIEQSGSVHIGSGDITIEENADLWKILRVIQNLFTVDGKTSADSYSFGFFGYFGYDTVRFIETLPRKIEARDGAPDICLSVFEGVIKFDLANRTAELIKADSTLWAPTPLDDITRHLAGETLSEIRDDIPEVPAPLSISDSITQQRYAEIVQQALYHIGIGDIYQVQLGHELTIRSAADPLAVYRRLRARNPAPYMYLAQLGSATLIGASPEVFLRAEAGTITMRPLAGTIRRGRDDEEDAAAAAKLRADEKEIAEHVMLVDLCRNDIGRICIPRTLAVTELLAIEKYSHVFHLVSNVIGKVSEEIDIYDAIAATFPAGTMTGAPKVRAMEIIEELETSRRGVYAGAVGLIDFSGYANLALCIRTAIHDGRDYVIRASAGIVADSHPDQEWRETRSKLGATYWAITGTELTP